MARQQASALLYGVLLFVTLWAAGCGQGYRDGCCFGKRQHAHGEVFVVPGCDTRLVCEDGDIKAEYYYDDPTQAGGGDYCEFNGQVFSNGTQLPAQCAPLVCVEGRWVLLQDGIEDCCEHCSLYNIGHVSTFDNNHYHWSGPCNYSVAQTGLSHHPEVAVFSLFHPCFTNSFCLQITKFRNDPDTFIALRHTTFQDAMFSMLVSGHHYTVPEEGVEEVRAGSTRRPVLAWRAGSCLFLLGSSGLMLQKCPDRLDVWTYPTHTAALHGLCGHFNFIPSDDMTARDGGIHPVQPFPLAFPESWRGLEQFGPSSVCRQPCEDCVEPTRDDPCVATEAEKKRYHVLCSQRLHPVLGRDTELKYHVDACELDLCLLDQAGISEVDQLKWLLQTEIITQNSKILLAKTKGLVLPEPLFPPLSGVCLPESSWRPDCNWCSCSQDGSVPICTLIACAEDFVPEFGGEFCSSGSVWRRGDCVCTCLNGGQICSFDECVSPAPATAQTTPTTPTTTSPPFFICSLPMEPGQCYGQIMRWYYNFGQGQCYLFTYTGCDGNLNNFETEEECKAACGFFDDIKTDPTTLACPLDDLTCPADCAITFIIDPITKCPMCVCDY